LALSYSENSLALPVILGLQGHWQYEPNSLEVLQRFRDSGWENGVNGPYTLNSVGKSELRNLYTMGLQAISSSLSYPWWFPYMESKILWWMWWIGSKLGIQRFL
jgi:hypothetical protein